MDETDIPTGAELGELIGAIARALRYRSAGIAPHQHRALRVISREPIRPARLADRLRITPRAVTDVVDALSDQGLIEIQADPTDRRAKILEITEPGRTLLAELNARRAAISEEYFSDVSPEDRKKLASILQSLPHRGPHTH